jgi:hypothetical protein
VTKFFFRNNNISLYLDLDKVLTISVSAPLTLNTNSVTTVSQQANYNMAPGLQMMNPRGATTAAPRGPSASRSSKPQSQQQQQSVNQTSTH